MKIVACWMVVALTLVAAQSASDEPRKSAGQGMTLWLELFVSDLEKSADFYTRVLGFQRMESAADYIPVRCGSVVIGLGPASKLPKPHFFNPELMTARRGLGTEIVLEVDDVQSCFDQVKKSGYKKILSSPQVRPWGARDFRLADPDGYYLRITSR